jgi:hypothetical protein
LTKDADTTIKKGVGVLKIGFLNIEGLHSKLGTTDFLDLLKNTGYIGYCRKLDRVRDIQH